MNINNAKTVCAVILLNRKDEALLQLRDKKDGLSASGLWVFPGGHCDKNESLIDCANREFLEETGYKCENLKYLLSIEDNFISKESKSLHIFYEIYDFNKKYICLEGVSLEFLSLEMARKLKMPDYLSHIWNLAILANKTNQPKIY
jgi:8-oxo-dGTP pyrophosphatase MutT (NUDIX family)